MSRLFKIKILIILLFVSNLSFSQIEDGSTNTIETIIENIASNIDGEIDYTTLYDQLIHIYNNPININTCSAKDLEKLYFINSFQIKQLIDYREKYGKIYSIYELQLIKGFNNDLIAKLIPFISVETVSKKQNFNFKNTFKYGKHQLFFRTQRIIEDQAGYFVPDSNKTESNHYLGNPYKIYAKYQFKFSNKIQFGITAEKDAGEEFFKGTQPNGFDFYSAYLQINNIGIVKKVIIGDYLAQFGQGLTIYRGLSFGKSTDVNNILKSSRGIRKYSSSNELEYFRGGAITVGKNNWEISTFYSNHNIDGSIKVDTSESVEEYINSLYSVADHGTISGVNKKNAINEQAFGANLSYSFSKLKIGATGVYSKYSHNIIPSNDKDKKFGFIGDENYNLGIDYQIGLNRFYFFGEYATDKNLNTAFLTGVNIKIVEQIYLSTIYRNYSVGYVGLYSNGFAEGSSTNNEAGIYTGIVYHPYKSIKISGYWDSYKFNWMKYRIYSPSNGFDYFLQAEYTPLRDFMIQAYVRQEIKKQNISEQENAVQKITDINKIRYRLHLAYKINGNITLKNRFEAVSYSNGINKKSKGYLLYQDIAFRPTKIPTVFYTRLAFFDTHNYDSRIYAYENDVLYSFSVPAYYGKGMRYYFMVKHTIIKNLDVWIRFAQTVYTDRNVIGSGLTEIQGNKKSEIKLQLRYKF